MSDENHAPSIGSVLHDFHLPDENGTMRELATLCAERPQVLVLYRGNW